MKIEQSDVELETFWAKESVFFKSKSLGYICKYLERWYNVKINVDPKIAESQFYTFTVKMIPWKRYYELCLRLIR